jgi:ketosteroid isomerase-like protein
MAMFAAFAAHDLDRMLAIADPGIVVDAGQLAERTGRSDSYRGHEGLSELLSDLAKIWDDLRVTPREYRHLGGAVLVTATLSARSEGAMMLGTVAWVYRVRRRRVVSIEVFRSGDDALAARNTVGA